MPSVPADSLTKPMIKPKTAKSCAVRSLFAALPHNQSTARHARPILLATNSRPGNVPGHGTCHIRGTVKRHLPAGRTSTLLRYWPQQTVRQPAASRTAVLQASRQTCRSSGLSAGRPSDRRGFAYGHEKAPVIRTSVVLITGAPLQLTGCMPLCPARLHADRPMLAVPSEKALRAGQLQRKLSQRRLWQLLRSRCLSCG